MRRRLALARTDSVLTHLDTHVCVTRKPIFRHKSRSALQKNVHVYTPRKTRRVARETLIMLSTGQAPVEDGYSSYAPDQHLNANALLRTPTAQSPKSQHLPRPGAVTQHRQLSFATKRGVYFGVCVPPPSVVRVSYHTITKSESK